MHRDVSEELTTRRATLGGIGAGATALLAGCAGITEAPSVEDVQVRLSGVRSPDIGLDSVTLPVELAFTNTGSNDVPGLRLQARLYINGNDVGTSRTSVGDVSAGDTVDSVLATTINYSEASSSVVDALRAGAFALSMDGELVSDGLLMDARQGFEAQFQVG
jgi:hypothetical protein